MKTRHFRVRSEISSRRIICNSKREKGRRRRTHCCSRFIFRYKHRNFLKKKYLMESCASIWIGWILSFSFFPLQKNFAGLFALLCLFASPRPQAEGLQQRCSRAKRASYIFHRGKSEKVEIQLIQIDAHFFLSTIISLLDVVWGIFCYQKLFACP